MGAPSHTPAANPSPRDAPMRVARDPVSVRVRSWGGGAPSVHTSTCLLAPDWAVLAGRRTSCTRKDLLVVCLLVAYPSESPRALSYLIYARGAKRGVSPYGRYTSHLPHVPHPSHFTRAPHTHYTPPSYSHERRTRQPGPTTGLSWGHLGGKINGKKKTGPLVSRSLAPLFVLSVPPDCLWSW